MNIEELIEWIEAGIDPPDLVELLIDRGSLEYEDLIELLDPYIRECKSHIEKYIEETQNI